MLFVSVLVLMGVDSDSDTGVLGSTVKDLPFIP
jgi:hypothetical protein